MYSRYFSFAGIGVTTACDGGEAFEVAHSYPPDVIVLDLAMPGMNGWQFLKQVRVDPRLKNVPVIVVTADDRDGIGQEARAAGADAFITKPCLPAVLVAEIRRVASRAAGPVEC